MDSGGLSQRHSQTLFQLTGDGPRVDFTPPPNLYCRNACACWRVGLPNQLHLRPTQQLQPAVTYSLQRETLDTLQSGLSAPIDSLIRSSWRTISTFSVWDEMKLGSAQICLPPIEKLCVEVRHLGTTQSKSYHGQPDLNGCLTLSPLPEGKYSVGGYVDQNENQRFDSGTLSPWRAAEPFFSWSDTLFVKRGETTL